MPDSQEEQSDQVAGVAVTKPTESAVHVAASYVIVIATLFTLVTKAINL